MDLVELIFYTKIQGSKRCPRAELTTTLDMEDYLAQYKPGATAVEVTE